ncbi:MAG: hypothetical protein J6D54_13780 [Olsenella sp.]|nr:hypothetical protein [Olsenella sp.]
MGTRINQVEEETRADAMRIAGEYLQHRGCTVDQNDESDAHDLVARDEGTIVLVSVFAERSASRELPMPQLDLDRQALETMRRDALRYAADHADAHGVRTDAISIVLNETAQVAKLRHLVGTFSWEEEE